MNTVLSVIIPCYQGEKTLRRAVDSVLNQTLKEIELIIVNDGSSDSSLMIATEYADRDSRVKVVDKKINEGLSKARNSGMEYATGTYLTFLDADDWCDPEMYRTMIENGDDADVIVTGAYHDVLNADGSVSVSTEDRTGRNAVLIGEEEISVAAVELDCKRLFAYSWNKLFRTSFLRGLQVLYQQQTLIEDYEFNCLIWSHIKKLTLVDGCYYHYIKFSTEALTQRYLPDYFEIMGKRYSLMKSLLKEKGIYQPDTLGRVASIHLKHVLAGMIKCCSNKASLSLREEYCLIRKSLTATATREALRLAKGERKQEKMCNFLLRLRSVLLCHFAAKILYAMQKSKNNLFDRIK